MDCESCREEFNKLSKPDRVKLQGAAVTKAITNFVKEDTESSPWRYPFYAAYLICIATPLPFIGAATILIAGTVLWARSSKSEYAQRLNGRLKEAFNNHARLVCEHRDYLKPSVEDPDRLTVKNKELVWHTTKAGLQDSWDSTKIAWNAAKRFVFGPN